MTFQQRVAKAEKMLAKLQLDKRPPPMQLPVNLPPGFYQPEARWVDLAPPQTDSRQ